MNTQPISPGQQTPLSDHVGATASATIAGHILTLRPPNPTLIDAIKSFFRKLFGSTPEKEIYKAIARHQFQNEYASQDKINAIVKEILTPTSISTFRVQVKHYLENVPTPPDLKSALEEATNDQEAIQLFQEHLFKHLVEKGYTPPEFALADRGVWEGIMQDIGTAAIERKNLQEGDKDQRTPEKILERSDILRLPGANMLRKLMQAFLNKEPPIPITENNIKGTNSVTNFAGDKWSFYFTQLKLNMQALQANGTSLSQMVPWGQKLIDYFKKNRGNVSTDAIAKEFGPLFYPIGGTKNQGDPVVRFKEELES